MTGTDRWKTCSTKSVSGTFVMPKRSREKRDGGKERGGARSSGGKEQRGARSSGGEQGAKQDQVAEHYESTLCALSADATCELNVLGHDCDAFGVNGTQVSVFKEAN